MFGSLRNNIGIARNLPIRAIGMHKLEAGKFQTGNTFPKQYWLAVNGKPEMVAHLKRLSNIATML